MEDDAVLGDVNVVVEIDKGIADGGGVEGKDESKEEKGWCERVQEVGLKGLEVHGTEMHGEGLRRGAASADQWT